MTPATGAQTGIHKFGPYVTLAKLYIHTTQALVYKAQLPIGPSAPLLETGRTLD
jgi:hypothetical protein